MLMKGYINKDNFKVIRLSYYKSGYKYKLLYQYKDRYFNSHIALFNFLIKQYISKVT